MYLIENRTNNPIRQTRNHCSSARVYTLHWHVFATTLPSPYLEKGGIPPYTPPHLSHTHTQTHRRRNRCQYAYNIHLAF
ncbi:hypothetical protein L1987_69260 [Smallanthus sonchifolius]|uniref:Uncharacterized protein n=1 Tax=Smallanthus sonchifolius TaxID=185202 RepID=A0ACB9B5C1_9ASTR|nr:hypothetical protein L1987_69260 [Smallanthus sonchifolius]